MMLRTTATGLFHSLLAAYWRLAHTSPQKGLSFSQMRILRALLQGNTLKSHRYLDGRKEYRLHPLSGEATLVPAQDVRPLEEQALILSNHKFPAATLSLSQQGHRAAVNAKEATGTPPSVKNTANSFR